MKGLVARLCPTLCDPTGCSFSVHGILQVEYWNGCRFLLKGIFQTQGSNAGLPHCRQLLYHLSHQGSQDLFQISSSRYLLTPLILYNKEPGSNYLYQESALSSPRVRHMEIMSSLIWCAKKDIISFLLYSHPKHLTLVWSWGTCAGRA